MVVSWPHWSLIYRSRNRRGKVRIRPEDIPVRLPTASTCFNLLKLPNFKSRKVLKEKLLYAIKAEAGFDLS